MAGVQHLDPRKRTPEFPTRQLTILGMSSPCSAVFQFFPPIFHFGKAPQNHLALL
jgi:hypothetical protein